MALKQRLVPVTPGYQPRCGSLPDSQLPQQTSHIELSWRAFPSTLKPLLLFGYLQAVGFFCLLGAHLLLQLSMFCLQPVGCELHPWLHRFSLHAWDVLSASVMSWLSAINFPSGIYCAVVKRDDICWTTLQVHSLSYPAILQYTVIPLPRWLLCPFCTLTSSRSYFSVPWGSITASLHKPPNFTAWDLWCVLTFSSSFSPLCPPPLPC